MATVVLGATEDRNFGTDREKSDPAHVAVAPGTTGNRNGFGGLSKGATPMWRPSLRPAVANIGDAL